MAKMDDDTSRRASLSDIGPLTPEPPPTLSEETIAAVATPFGEGAIALLRLSGPRALEIADRVCGAGAKPSGLASRRQRLMSLHDAGGAKLDEALVSVHRAPASYTGEDVVEFACHGGIHVTRRVLEALCAAGARPAGPGEFTQRAFLHGKMDLTQAEGVMDLIKAQTDLALRSAAEQLDGRLGARIHSLRDDLLGLAAHVEAYIDFPDEDIDPDTGAALLMRFDAARAALDALLATAGQGRILREGVRTVIFGEPNVGKSSLLNALVGHERAIVSAIPGTTRDTIEEFISVRGLPLRLTDTAGLRASADPLENAGMERTRRTLAQADLTLRVVDASQPPSAGAIGDPSDKPETPSAASLLIFNKVDLGIDPRWSSAQYPDALRVSCRTGDGLDELADAIYQRVTGGQATWNDSGAAINARHQACLARARESLQNSRAALAAGISPEFVAMDLRAALDAVGEVIGGTETDDILGHIFSTFCIGK
jgi:tRNA modification GTPase